MQSRSDFVIPRNEGSAFRIALTRVESQIDLTPCSGCDKCGIKCGAGVQMSRDEFEAVQKYRAANIGTVSSVESQDKTLDLGDGVTVQMCRFRDMERGGCAVYAA